MENQLAELIYKLNQAQDRYLQEKLPSTTITLNQARLIHYLKHHPQAMQKEVATYLGKSEASTSNILKQLEKKNLLARSSADQRKVAKQIQLTVEGKELSLEIEQAFDSLNLISPRLYRQELDNKLSELLQELLDYYS